MMLRVQSDISRVHSSDNLLDAVRSVQFLNRARVASEFDNWALERQVQMAPEQPMPALHFDKGLKTRSESTESLASLNSLPDSQTFERYRSDDAGRNLFDCEPYYPKAAARVEFERKLGEALCDDPRIRDVARRIRALTGTPMRYDDFDAAAQAKIFAERVGIGGAHECLHSHDTLDAHVLATLIKAEAPHYDAPDAPNPKRRRNMFNAAPHPENPMHPWNLREFDVPIAEIKSPKQLPERIKAVMQARWDALRNAPSDEHVFRAALVRAGVARVYEDAGFAATDDVVSYMFKCDIEERKRLLHDALDITWSTAEYTRDEANGRDLNPVGPDVRQHRTGDRSNMVRTSDRDDPQIAKFALGAILHDKPVISGPSGHTLRYLNHYAQCKEMASYSTDVSDWPSLADARIVMMANLMPPKNHHSYHEIMSASIGVTDGSEMLHYRDRAAYADLNDTALGATTLARLKDDAQRIGAPADAGVASSNEARD
ncbi:hypothetical protein AB870_11755 [Pandoraea faecigallinarum]|uniref:Uncharacterized protein n=1 Tax=Pandoraea faecigallinarum TaxID=656179 RepID=A0A173GZK3_9BURK|nr:hypothetical protein [Pandoraea faecigallinarum]ANI21625.1 hypothetical protein AB870_11755 [Pandoraea faecigallinarum]